MSDLRYKLEITGVKDIQFDTLDQAIRTTLGPQVRAIYEGDPVNVLRVWSDVPLTAGDETSVRDVINTHDAFLISVDRITPRIGDTVTITIQTPKRLTGRSVNIDIDGVSTPVALTNGVGTTQIIIDKAITIILANSNQEQLVLVHPSIVSILNTPAG